MDTPSPSAPDIDSVRSSLRASASEGKTLREAVTDLVMEEAIVTMRELRKALATSQERAAGYMLAWEQAEKHNAVLQGEKRDHQRIHADLLRLLDALWPTTQDGAMGLLAELHRKYVEGA